MSNTTNAFDYVFVGAGHNALIAASYLVKEGHSVCLLDQRPAPGGWVHSEELTLPGFVHDTFSAGHPLFVAGPVFAELGSELGEYGLRYVQGEVSTGASFPDGRSLVIETDPEALAAELSRLGELDAWTQLMADVDGRWTTQLAEAFADRVISEAAQHIPGLDQIILARHILSPADLARGNPNAGPGDHASGHNELSQAFIHRPIPAHRGGYNTVVPDLYLIGAASWPGPGVSGASGRAVARHLLAGTTATSR
jgi:phytoene dehydrogenase-like protein